jgi:signal transduction histidine kinase
VSAPQQALPSGLVHDLRTPLNQIIGYSEMLIEQAEEIGKREFVSDLKKVNQAGHQLLSIINNNSQPSDAADSLPVVAVTITGPLSEPGVQTSTGAGQSLVLVVDDNEANRDVLSRRLVRQGYATATAESGQQALEMLYERAFDLVLLDIMMPEMDGYEVLQRVKADEQLRHIPVIVISAMSEMDSVARGIEMGAEDYLPKPFNPILLKARVSACLEKKRSHDREMRLYDQLQQNYKRLQELERLRDDLTHMIIHDLRTPLTSVITGMQSLDLVGDINEDQRELMDIAIGGGQTLLGMINDLLDVDKLESGAMQLDLALISPAEMVASAISQIDSLAHDKGLIILQKVEPDMPPIRADEGKIRRTLVNLLGNAIKFTPRGGTISVEARHCATSESDVFSVTDTGEGIPSEAFSRIFEKFGQVEARKAGRTMSTGLGLAFCKLAVEAHGGHIKVNSTPGKGSTFSFTLPNSVRQNEER